MNKLILKVIVLKLFNCKKGKFREKNLEFKKVASNGSNITLN